MRRHHIYILASFLLTACNENMLEESIEVSSENIIQVGGVETDVMSVSTELTRANEGQRKDAETEQWLQGPLKEGLDITYGKVDGATGDNAVAKLKLVADTNNSLNNAQDYGIYDSKKGYNVKNGLAVYTFKTLDASGEETTPAIWFGNGAHFFQGVYVPNNIRYINNVSEIDDSNKAPNLTTDLSGTGDNSNYTLLERYLGMPANTRLSATIERIKLPFRHRLAHVIVYILIDPSISGATIKGYSSGKDANGKWKEDPTTSSILFRNVMMLKGVHDEYDDATKLHTLTPQWENFVPRVTPHFFGEHGSVYSNGTEVKDSAEKPLQFILFTNNRTKAAIFPSDDSKWDQAKTEWEARKNAYLTQHASDAEKETKAIEHANAGTYTRVEYGFVPCYDIILRPTYTTEANVMYDEAGYNTEQGRKDIAALKNNIDFDIVLSNDLQYEKSVAIDLNANEETVVYLRISRESIDYNTSGAEKWIRDTANDGWYGLNNKNGNTLSKAGSSWQRAYTFGAEVEHQGAENYTNPNSPSGVTDGQFYNASSSHEEQENAQYFTSTYQAQWIEKFLQAYHGGAHHGDYFALKSDITIDARLIPQDFVFTGHLDGQDSTITLTNMGEPVYKEAENISERLYTRSGSVYAEWNIPTLYVKLVTPIYYTEEELAIVNDVSYVKTTLLWKDTQYIYYTEEEANAENIKPEHHPLITDSNGRNPDDDGYEETRDTEQYVSGYIPLTINTVKETIAAHYETTETSVQATISDIKEYQTTYPVATDSTSPAYPTTLEQLKTNEYYSDDHSGTRFTCPQLYQFSHNSPSYLFAGLNGTYTTVQESNINAVWEANVHKETNKQTIWVPVAGYRAEVLNVKVAGGTLFQTTTDSGTGVTTMTPVPYTGNVQNCFNGATAIPNNTPALPQYK